jgi:cystathionine gamma-synthase
MTKYLGGHSGVVVGALVTSERLLCERIKFLQNAVGAIPGPLGSWRVLRGLKSLSIRMEKHCSNAMQVARWLEGCSEVERVVYPGLESHPQFAIARKQMRGFGGMISLILKGGEGAARKMVERLRLFSLAESLGGVESLIELPAAMTHQYVAQSPRAVDPALVRVSVGIENPLDLIADIAQSLSV